MENEKINDVRVCVTLFLCPQNQGIYNNVFFRNQNKIDSVLVGCVCQKMRTVSLFLLFFYNEPELGASRIDPGMALTPFPSSILDELRFEPTTFRS